MEDWNYRDSPSELYVIPTHVCIQTLVKDQNQEANTGNVRIGTE